MAPRSLTSIAAALVVGLLPLLTPGPVGAARLTIDWAGAGTDRDPGTWTIHLSEVAEGGRGSYTIDGGPRVPIEVGETEVPVPRTLGPHRILARAPDGLTLTDTRTIVDDDPTPPQLTVKYAGKETTREPGVWMITMFDPESPQASGTYQVDDGPKHPLGPGATVVAVPYVPGRYTITVTATNNDRDGPGDEDTVTVTDTREIK